MNTIDRCPSRFLDKDFGVLECSRPEHHTREHWDHRDGEYNVSASHYERGYSVGWDDGSAIQDDNNRWFRYKELRKVDAAGAIEDDNPGRIDTGYRFLEEFRAGRNLRYTLPSIEMIPWLFKAKFYSKKWEDTYNISPPYGDHFRAFVDRDTNQRIATSQPYFLDINGYNKLPKEFYDICNRCEPDPQDAMFKQIVGEIVEKARAESESFAQQHGLNVKVSPNSWYNPGKTILIEYVKKDK